MSTEEFTGLKKGDFVHFKGDVPQLRPETYVVLGMFANGTMARLCDIRTYNKFVRETAFIFSFSVGSCCAREMSRGHYRR